jgi:hypothetical protein
MNEQLKTCIEGECGELIINYSLEGHFFKGNEQT